MGENYSGGMMKGSIKNSYSKDCPKFPDSSTGLKGCSVNDRAKRDGVAKTPKTLGPRKTGM